MWRFFGFSSPADYAKELINTKNADKNKGIVEEIEDRISDLESRIKQMSDKEKEEKNSNETLEINKILGYNKNAKKFFHCASKVDKKKKKKSEPKIEESIAERVKLKNNRIAEIKKIKNIYNELFKKYFANYQSSSDMYKRLCDTKGKKIKIKYI